MPTTSNGRFAAAVMEWFAANGRELPWRGIGDPYAIWLSEVILQQTRIQQGRAYWERFMRRWPTVDALAAATEDEVLREWQGLGYYSRARNLHHAARQIVAMGHFPNTYEEIRRLKGVGDYTAAAVGSMAFGLPVAAVDGNVYRVLARRFGIDTPINTTEGKKTFAQLANALLPRRQAGTFNQALMDFGALLCTPQSPRCPSCPLQGDCEAFRGGRVGELPVKLRKTQVKTRNLIYIYVRWQGRTAFRRRGAGDIWQGLWEPLLLSDGGELPPAVVPLRRQVRHVLTHRILLADFYLWEPMECPPLPEGYEWIAEDDLESHAVPRLVEILLEEVNGR